MKRNIDTALIANPPPIPPGKKRLVIFDAKIAGLILLITESSMTYYFRLRSGGVNRDIRIGRVGDISLSDARRNAAVMRGLAASGKVLDFDSGRTKKKSLTFSVFVDDHLRPYKSIRKRSWGEDERMLKHRLLPAWGVRDLSTITAGDVRKLCDDIVVHDGRSKSTSNRYTALCKTTFGLAHRWGLIETNPAAGLELFAEPEGRDRVLSVAEMGALHSARQLEPDRTGAIGVEFLLATGARLGEALAAKWSEIDLAGRSWAIPRTKSGRPMVRRLSGYAVGLLQRLSRGADDLPVFPSPRDGSHRRDLQRVWTRACESAGIKDCRVHDLRHCFASILANKGISQYVIQQMLGHRTAAMTQRYSHIQDSTLITATDIVGDALVCAIAAPATSSSTALTTSPVV